MATALTRSSDSAAAAWGAAVFSGSGVVLATPGRSEALEGFTAGVVSALGMTMAATLTELAPLLRYGNLIQDSSVLANLTQAVIRGVSFPLVAAAATGYISAALWKGQGPGRRRAGGSGHAVLPGLRGNRAG
jgi:hypothetical protein